MRESSRSITGLPLSPDEDRQRRFRLYFYMMLVRVVSLVIFFIVPGWWKLVPAALAVFIPFFAVVVANVSTHRQPEGIEAPNALPPGSAASPEPEPVAPQPAARRRDRRPPERDVL